MRETIKRQRLFFISLIGIVVVSLIMGTTFAYQTIVIDKQEGASTDVSLNIGKLNVSYTKNNENINLTNMPLLNNYKSADYIELVINSNDSTDDVAYQITLKGLEYTPILASTDFKYTLTELIDGNEIHIKTGDFSSLTSTEFTLMDGSFKYLKKGNTQTIRLYLWLEETSEVQNDFENAIFKGQIQISSVYANETTSDIAMLSGTLLSTYSKNFKINLKTTEAIEDSEIATKAMSFPFTVENTGETHQNITIKLTDIKIDDVLKDIDFRWGLYNVSTGNGLAFGAFSKIKDKTEMTIYNNTIIDSGDVTTNKNYELRIWVHNDGSGNEVLLNKNFKANLSVTGESVEYTPEECFTIDSTGRVIEFSDSDSCKKEILVIPKIINNIEVKKIDLYKVYSFSGSSNIIIPSGPTSIDSPVGVYLNDLTIPESVESLSFAAGNDFDFNNLFIPSTLNYLSIGDINITENVLVVPGSVASFSEEMYTNDDFIFMEGIKTISIIDWSSNITYFEIPSSVKNLYITANMSNLTNIIIRGKNSLDDFDNVSIDGDYAESVTITFPDATTN